MKDIAVKEVMIPISDYVTVKRENNLSDVLKAIEDKRRAGQGHAHRDAIVVDENGRFMGKVTMIDIFRSLDPYYRKPVGEKKRQTLTDEFVNKMIKEGRMTKIGLAKIEKAKKTGLWEKDDRPQISLDIPAEFAKALARNKKAKENFDKLAPTYRRHYIGWISVAKRPETKKRRIEESIALLEKGQKLGLK